MVRIIGGKTFRSVKERVNSRLSQHRHAVHGIFQDRLKVVEIFGQLIEFKVLGNIERPRLRDRFERTQKHLARVFLVVCTLVRHAQHGHLRQAGDGFGHNVKMFASMQRDVHARHTTNGMPPHAATVHHMLCFNRARLAVFALPTDARHAAPILVDIRDKIPLLHQSSILAGTFGKRMRDVGRIALTIERQVNAAFDPLDVEMFIPRLHLIG